MKRNGFWLTSIGVLLAATGCGESGAAESRSDTNEATSAAQATQIALADEAEASTPADQPAEADWSGINDAATRAAIDGHLDSFAQETGQRFGLLVVDSLSGADRFQAAGEAAFDLGTPAIVVSLDQRDIQLVGDEALAYDVASRERIARETAAYFDRGDFAEGVSHALDAILASWNAPG